MKHDTVIDTLKLQIDLEDADTQRRTLTELCDHLVKTGSLTIKHKDYMHSGISKRLYFIYSNSRTIGTISTYSYYLSKKYKTQHYISMNFTGLKKYNELLDTTANNCVIGVCAYLNTRGILFKLTGLDICIDVRCTFDHMVAVCTRRTSRTQYYRPLESQIYPARTSYIEKIEKYNLSRVTQRAYLYDKSNKGNLDDPITRFEIKLQSRFFSRYGINIESIEKALGRYHVMYFKDISTKHHTLEAYNSYKVVRKKEVAKLELDRYRLYANMNFINNFIHYLFEINEYKLRIEKRDKLKTQGMPTYSLT